MCRSMSLARTITSVPRSLPAPRRRHANRRSNTSDVARPVVDHSRRPKLECACVRCTSVFGVAAFLRPRMCPRTVWHSDRSTVHRSVCFYSSVFLCIAATAVQFPFRVWFCRFSGRCPRCAQMWGWHPGHLRALQDGGAAYSSTSSAKHCAGILVTVHLHRILSPGWLRPSRRTPNHSI